MIERKGRPVMMMVGIGPGDFCPLVDGAPIPGTGRAVTFLRAIIAVFQRAHRQGSRGCEAGPTLKRHHAPPAKTLRSTDHVVLEASMNTWPIAELLSAHAGRVVVSNPMRTRAIASAKVKTDRIDSAILAQLLAADFIPAVWVPDSATRALRRQVSHRQSLSAIKDLTFDRARMLVPALSPRHFCRMMERTAGPLVKLVESLTASNPDRLASFRSELATLVADYFGDNVVRQDYLLTRATKI